VLVVQTQDIAMTKMEAVDIFARRWKEAKASGKTIIAFEKDKWELVDLLIEEAQRAQEIRLNLIGAVAKLKSLDDASDVREESSLHEGDVHQRAGDQPASRAA